MRLSDYQAIVNPNVTLPVDYEFKYLKSTTIDVNGIEINSPFVFNGTVDLIRKEFFKALDRSMALEYEVFFGLAYNYANKLELPPEEKEMLGAAILLASETHIVKQPIPTERLTTPREVVLASQIYLSLMAYLNTETFKVELEKLAPPILHYLRFAYMTAMLSTQAPGKNWQLADLMDLTTAQIDAIETHIGSEYRVLNAKIQAEKAEAESDNGNSEEIGSSSEGEDSLLLESEDLELSASDS
jgi:hypothetical protein